MDGNFVGIGVRVIYEEESNGAYVYGVITDSGAYKAGLQKGDIIIEAEGVKSTDKDSYLNMVNAILGEENTDVSVKVKRGNEIIDFTITRAQVLSENVLYEKLDGDIAYIQILTFSDGSLPAQFKAKMEMAKEDGCVGYIFDVRNNLGGLLTSVTGVLDPLLPEGPIINTIDKNGNKTSANSDAECFEAPMVVLCNRSTASAAELFTAALRDYEMSTIVGETTFGKGSMQSTKLLSDGSAIKITTELYTPPSGESYDGIGIKPDFEVKLDEEWVNKFQLMPREKDHQLNKALEILNSAE
jgi:carboxyl-terminal processing protease